MVRFLRRAPLILTPLPPPPPEVTEGMVLNQGFLFTLLSTVAAPELSAETLDALRAIDPECWYDGQHMETILNELEDRDPELPKLMGQSIYFMLRPELEKSGITSCVQMIEQLPAFWKFAVRGGRGEFRSTMLGPGAARVEMEQPFNCHFEEGALQGLLDSWEVRDVSITHAPCMRDGARCCVLDVRWSG
ncbi:hypothetical protein [Chondromyces apiculatus]|uniref:4-vinyl reductase 4VR domain-containing protein n=1 Tax=Chondromyces apiculatus DSM 436 TaxID=1192034 RepID=A0A017SWP4_9BACT|nr:hypothetical protein [Chondromyces apiculatus]EYF01393.1 Hypothetical protein CAP_8324 [Chondromyces apiculatus DSM 436]